MKDPVEKRRDELPEWINKRIIRLRQPNDCWLWTGPKTESGYGRVNIPASVHRQGLFQLHQFAMAHRIVWHYLIDNDFPIWEESTNALLSDHRCLDKSCVNPNHLRLVTNYVNTTEVDRSYFHSQYVGVSLKKDADRQKPWRAIYKRKLIGYYETENEAAEAYRKAAEIGQRKAN